MNRILEFSPSQEEAVVARILVLVHQAVDQHFPSAEQANRQFTKTVFSGEGEQTAGVRAAPDDDAPKSGSEFESDERTSPDGKSPEGGKPFIPPPPGRTGGGFPAQAPSASPSPADRNLGFGSGVNPLAIGQSGHSNIAGGLSKSTRLDATIDEMRSNVGLDWTMRLTLAALIAGLILLAYFIWKFLSLG